MNNHHKRRLLTICIFLSGLILASGLILFSFKKNLNVFLTPSQIESAHLQPDYHFRLGGMVKENSIQRQNASLAVRFIVTDFKREIPVFYQGSLPDLFREGKGMVAEGSLNAAGVFVATQVLAKHDENYIPSNVAKVMSRTAS